MDYYGLFYILTYLNMLVIQRLFYTLTSYWQTDWQSYIIGILLRYRDLKVYILRVALLQKMYMVPFAAHH